MKKTTVFISIILIFFAIGLQTVQAQVVFEHGDSVITVALSPVDNTLLASGSLDSTVKLWDVVNQTDVVTLEGHAAAVSSVAFSPNGMLLASGSFDGTVKLWNVETHTNIVTFDDLANPISSVAFSPDGTLLAAGAGNGTIKLWDAETHQNIATFGGYDAAVLAEGGWFTPVSFLSNAILAAGAADSIKLWDVTTEENIATFKVPRDPVISVSCSPDGTTLAAGLLSGLIRLWDIETLKNTTIFPAVSTAFIVPYTLISFSPDGTQIASTVDENVVLWDIETETQISTLSGHTDAVRSVSFSPDGILASGGLDGTVRFWDGSSPPSVLVASTTSPLTEATLDGSVVTLTLTDHQFDRWVFKGDVSVSGIDGVAYRPRSVNRVSDTELKVELEFDGTNFDSDSTLTFTVDGWAILGPNPDLHVPSFTAQVPVSATPESNPTVSMDTTVSISPGSVASPAVGEALTFSLNITGGENVAGYQATVMFNPTAIDYVDSANGDYLPADSLFVSTGYDWRTRSVTLAANTLAGAANGDGTLATLTFQVDDFKASTLTLSEVYLVDSSGKLWEVHTENAEITLPPEPVDAILGDLNRDGVVNIQDLAIVGARLGQKGHNSADLNGDGLVDIVDLVLVANELGAAAAAPSLTPQVLAQLTAADVKDWLNQTKQLELTDPAYVRGIAVLEQLHKALTPKVTVLLPNFPNPFNPETWIPYHLSKDADVTLQIYAINGTLVRTLTLGHRAAGMYQNRSRAAYWDGKNEFGEKVASGLYFYTLKAGDFTATRKMLIRK